MIRLNAAERDRAKDASTMSASHSAPASASENFYRDLQPVDAFGQSMEISRYVDLPDDWVIVVTDVLGSTKAIANGAYKSVNTVGVAGIAAICNAVDRREIPYVFGGDGFTCAVPASLVPRVRIALLGARQLARDGFGLDLRLGIVPVTELRRTDNWVRVLKVRQSQHVTQAAFAGRGWETAERWVKDPARSASYAVEPRDGESAAEADFSGFECRWQGVQAFNGHKLAILVQSMVSDPRDAMQVYDRVLKRIDRIYGNVSQYHPLRAGMMRLSHNLTALRHETTVRTFSGKAGAVLVYGIKIWLQSFIGRFLLTRRIATAAVDWGTYRDDLVANTDFRKFDGMLRMVIDGTDSQADELQRFLEEERLSGRLVYGLHKSSHALVTCVVISHSGDHRHFVDGGDGGYALAARQLKEQLRARQDVTPFKPTGT